VPRVCRKLMSGEEETAAMGNARRVAQGPAPGLCFPGNAFQVDSTEQSQDLWTFTTLHDGASLYGCAAANAPSWNAPWTSNSRCGQKLHSTMAIARFLQNPAGLLHHLFGRAATLPLMGQAQRRKSPPPISPVLLIGHEGGARPCRKGSSCAPGRPRPIFAASMPR